MKAEVNILNETATILVDDNGTQCECVLQGGCSFIYRNKCDYYTLIDEVEYTIPSEVVEALDTQPFPSMNIEMEDVDGSYILKIHSPNLHTSNEMADMVKYMIDQHRNK